MAIEIHERTVLFPLGHSGYDDVLQAGTIFMPENLNQSAVCSLLFLPEFGYNRRQSEECARKVAKKLGASCLALDLLGHGESEGRSRQKFTINDQLKGALNAYDYLMQHDGYGTPAGVVGSSFGAYLAVLVAAARRESVKSLILRAPGAYPDHFKDLPHSDYALGAQINVGQQLKKPPRRQELEDFRQDPQQLARSENMEIIRNFSGSVTIVRSTQDERIKPTVIEAYAEAAASGNNKVNEIINIEAPHILDGSRLAKFSNFILTAARTTLTCTH